jgi:hypothetical protein
MNETTDHLMLGCNYSEAIWNQVAGRFNLPSYSQLPVDQGPKACISAIITSGAKKEK